MKYKNLLSVLESFWKILEEEASLEKMGKGYFIGYNSDFLPISSEYEEEIKKLKKEVDRIADIFGYSYVGRAEKSLDYASGTGLGFRVGFKDVGHGVNIVLVPNRNLEKILNKKEVNLTKTASYNFDSLISKIKEERKLDSVLSQYMVH